MSNWKWNLFGSASIRPRETRGDRATTSARRRLVPAELMEPRIVLSINPIDVGVVYLEQDAGSDLHGDRFEVTFSGGAAGTTLDQLVINGDQQITGFSVGDVFFDIKDGGLGGDHGFDFQVASESGIDRVQATVVDGETQLILDFEGFQAGDRLVFEIDVDEVEDYDPFIEDLAIINEGFDPITSGVEFQGSLLTAHFSATHFYDAVGSAEFRNRYDEQLTASGLDLPADNASGQRDRTAAAFVVDLEQQAIPAAIGGYVYHDRNNDGIRDVGEEGLSGIRIDVVPVDTIVEQTVLTVTTDANGYYHVTGIAPGTYRIVEVAQPTGYLDGKDTAGTVDRAGAGIAANDEIGQIFLGGGAEGRDYNFGELVPITIGGNVHLSTPDGDCFGDNVLHEPVAGAKVLLLDAQGTVIDETVTDAKGNYEFQQLRPGVYGLVEITPPGLIDGGARAGRLASDPTQPLGHVGDDGSITAIRLSSGQTAADFDFCEHVGATISGHVYHDRDNDGARESNEEGIAGVLIQLVDRSGTAVAVQVTDARGVYEFTDVVAGEYSIVETQPLGWTDGLDRAGMVAGSPLGVAANPGDQISGLVIRWGEVGQNYDFGEFQPVSIRGRAQTSNQAGDCFGPAENHDPIVGATIELLDTDEQVIAQTTTDADGFYEFSGLPPGEYGVREITPLGLFDAGAAVGRVAGVELGTVAADGSVRNIRLTSGQVVEDVLFCDHVPAMLSGNVYHDQNGSGKRDNGESPIGEVTVELIDAAGSVVMSTTTGADGTYQFANIQAGTYGVRELQPQGYLDGNDSPGKIDGRTTGAASQPGDVIRGVEIGWGDRGIDFDFGELLPGSISGRVHTDIVTDCVFDAAAGETGLAGIQIDLWGPDGAIVATTLTNAQGQYRFDGLVPATYTIRQTQSNDYFDGRQTSGSQGGDTSVVNEIRAVTVGSAGQLVDYNFCEIPAATLSGYVFQDGPAVELRDGQTLPERIADIRDGVRTPDDTMLPGVVLELRDGITGEPIRAESHTLPGRYATGPITTVTDANGFYEFVGLKPGPYAVYQRQPAGDLVDGVDTAGTTAGFVFNAGEPQNEQVLSTLAVNPQNDGIVRIALAPAAESRENNFSEIRVETIETPPTTRVPFTPPQTPTPPRRGPQLTFDNTTWSGSANGGGYTARPAGASASSAKPPTWHLSIINGGQPRGDGVETRSEGSIWLTAAESGRLYENVTGGQWLLPVSYGAESTAAVTLHFGFANAIPVTGDFNGDGFDEIGVYVEGEWFIDLNGNGRWDDGDLWARLGTSRDLPVTGDWDGDGKWDIGIYGREWGDDRRALEEEAGLPDSDNDTHGPTKNIPPTKDHATNRARLLRDAKARHIRADVVDHVFRYGDKDHLPVAGDWNGDGVSSIGVFFDGEWKLDVDGNGRLSETDREEDFGQAGDIPLVGDWNGDGVDDIGVYRDGVCILDTNGNGRLDASDKRVNVGNTGDMPIVGDFNGDGVDEVAAYKPSGGGRIVYSGARPVDRRRLRLLVPLVGRKKTRRCGHRPGYFTSGQQLGSGPGSSAARSGLGQDAPDTKNLSRRRQAVPDPTKRRFPLPRYAGVGRV